MEKIYGLTPIETELMEHLWKTKNGRTFKEMTDFVNNDLKKGWKKQTLSTYLKNLQMMGLVSADDSKKNFIYYASVTKEEHVQNWTRKLVEKEYDNSIINFMASFTGGKALNKEDADELKKLLF